jgi:hypothetical protein
MLEYKPSNIDPNQYEKSNDNGWVINLVNACNKVEIDKGGRNIESAVHEVLQLSFPNGLFGEKVIHQINIHQNGNQQNGIEEIIGYFSFL